MNRRILFTVFLITFMFSHALLGQGYRGKKFTFSYQPGYAMANPSFDFKNIFMNQRVNVGFAISKHFSINLIGNYTNTRVLYPKINQFGSVQFKDYSAGIQLNYFRKNMQAFAPIGRYMGIGFEIGSQNLIRSETIYVPGTTYSNVVKTIDDKSRGQLYVITFNFGKNYLLKERFLLGYGIQYGIANSGGLGVRHILKPQFNIGIIF